LHQTKDIANWYRGCVRSQNFPGTLCTIGNGYLSRCFVDFRLTSGGRRFYFQIGVGFDGSGVGPDFHLRKAAEEPKSSATANRAEVIVAREVWNNRCFVFISLSMSFKIFAFYRPTDFVSSPLLSTVPSGYTVVEFLV
jgi:hypothetical protein